MTRSGYCEEPEDTIGFLIDVISREKGTNCIVLPPLLNAFMERQVHALCRDPYLHLNASKSRDFLLFLGL